MLQNLISIATLMAIVATLVTTIYGLWRMIQLTSEAREARVLAQLASRRAEEAAVESARLAGETVAIVAKQGVDIQELALNTNSIKDALIISTAKASHLEGRAEGIAEQKARDK